MDGFLMKFVTAKRNVIVNIYTNNLTECTGRAETIVNTFLDRTAWSRQK